MKDVYGSTWTLQLMIGFILLFVSFLTLTITYSKVFKVKNEVISIIEKYNGFNEDSASIINSYLLNSGYNTLGRCEGDNQIIGINDFNDNQGEEANEGTRYHYCVEKEDKRSYNDSIAQTTYEVTLFYRFNIPIIGDISVFTVKGKTTDLIDREDLFD